MVRLYTVKQVVLEQPVAEAMLWISCDGNAKKLKDLGFPFFGHFFGVEVSGYG